MNVAELDRICEALAAGGVVAIPTDTVYGLAVDPGVPGAVSRLFTAKGRPDQLAVPVLIADPEGLADLAEMTPVAKRLASRFWPGPLTLVLGRRTEVGFDLGGDPATIGVRCPACSIASELLTRAGPLAVTSANLHGEPPLHTAEEVLEHFGGELMQVLDGGRCDGHPSTVVSLVDTGLRCLRVGAIPFPVVSAAVAGLSA